MNFSVQCPGCGRLIPVTAAELGSQLVLECAACDTRFRAGYDNPEVTHRRTVVTLLAVILTILAALGGICFILWELGQEDPLVNIRLFANRNFAACNLLNFALGFVLNYYRFRWCSRLGKRRLH